jgi:1,4-dihydroxy-2-naphthoate octaprenyltransferase
MNAILPWFLALRPKTLTAALVPVVVASALVIAEAHEFQLYLSVCALLSAMFIQIGTNFINDAIDFKKGADDEKRIGPTRMTQSGRLSHRSVLLGGLVCFFIAALFGIPLVIAGGWVIVVIGVVSILCGYIYTGGPFPLAYVGLGDLFVILFFGLVAVMGTFFLHAHRFSLGSVVAGLQIGMLSTVLIAVNNLRDSPLDRMVNKKTLAVRFGIQFARIEIALLVFLPFILGFYWVFEGEFLAAVLPIFCFPLARNLVSQIYKTEPSPVYNKFLAQSAGVHLLFGLLLTIGLLIK